MIAPRFRMENIPDTKMFIPKVFQLFWLWMWK